MNVPPIYETILHHGGLWSQVIGRGKTLRLVDLEGGANVGMLLYNADQLTERYNMPDTLKGQQVFFLTHPSCLHSDMGRLLASITADTAGWHDTVCGCSDAALVAERYGQCSYQEARNEFHRNGRDCFLIELAKWGLGERDLVPNINWFSKVVADETGHLRFVPEAAKAGAQVDLRFEMNTLVVLNLCPHPLDASPEYTLKPVKLEVYQTGGPGPSDSCISSHPENGRALTNTENYYKLRD